MVRSANPASSAGYSLELESQAQSWIEEVTGEPFSGTFAEDIRDGRRLCNLINVIKPGSVRRVNNSAMPFKQMENTSNFLKASRAIGVPEYSLFETVDLFELKDLGLVVKCLHALGGTVQLNCPEFEGPHLGLKPAGKTTPAKKITLAKTWALPSPGQSSVGSYVPRATTGSSSNNSPAVTVQARQQESPARSASSPVRNVSSSPPRPASEDPATGASPPPPPFDKSATLWASSEEQPQALPPAYKELDGGGSPSKTEGVAANEPEDLSSRFSETMRVGSGTGEGIGSGSPSGSKSPPYKHALTGATDRPKSAVSTASTPTVSTKCFSPSRSDPASLSPESRASSAASRPGPASGARGGGYGLDAELAAKREANYDYQSEQEALEWIEDVTGEPFADVFGEELRNGRRLCRLINTIKPGAVRKVNDSRMPFKQMENISNFLKACRAVGVAEHSLFETVDLFDLKDLGLVVRCLHALGQTVQKTCPEYDGPRLGIKQTEANKREWTADQQRQQMLTSSGTMSQLMAGSSKTMERGAIIKEGVTFGANTAGTGDTSVPARWTMGSQATMERTSVTKTGPTFGADYAGTGDPNSSSQLTRGYR